MRRVLITSNSGQEGEKTTPETRCSIRARDVLRFTRWKQKSSKANAGSVSGRGQRQSRHYVGSAASVEKGAVDEQELEGARPRGR
jgi:hypothetical protein